MDAATDKGADLAFAGVAAQAELLRSRAVSAPELVRAHLDRIEAIDPRLNSFRVVCGERAVAEAERAQSRLDAGEEAPLLGVPLAVKDDTNVASELTCYGTRASEGVAERDAPVIARLRDAGAIVIGKTNVPELNLWPFTESSAWGVTGNPWAPDRTPGGSSGGSAAAVAAGLAAAALGSDSAGSVRIPAASCGVFGLKTQRGRVPVDALFDWHGMGVYGPITRGVTDAALLLDAMADSGETFTLAARTAPGPLRIGISTATLNAATRLDPDWRRAAEETAALLTGMGHSVRRADPDYGRWQSHVAVRYLRGAQDAAAALPHPERLERRTQGFLTLAGFVPDALLAASLARQHSYEAGLNAVFAGVDVLLTPVLAAPPPRARRWERRGALWTLLANAPLAPFTLPWNIAGNPAAAVPAGFGRDGMPLAVQLVGRPGAEATLLSLAGQLEEARPWADRRPPLGDQAARGVRAGAGQNDASASPTAA